MKKVRAGRAGGTVRTRKNSESWRTASNQYRERKPELEDSSARSDIGACSRKKSDTVQAHELVKIL